MRSKRLPRFRNDEEFARFVDTHDMAQYLESMERLDAAIALDPRLAERVKERAKKRLISLRLPLWQIEGAKRIAKRKNRPYQTLIQAWIAQGLRSEIQDAGRTHL